MYLRCWMDWELKEIMSDLIMDYKENLVEKKNFKENE